MVEMRTTTLMMNKERSIIVKMRMMIRSLYAKLRMLEIYLSWYLRVRLRVWTVEIRMTTLTVLIAKDDNAEDAKIGGDVLPINKKFFFFFFLNNNNYVRLDQFEFSNTY